MEGPKSNQGKDRVLGQGLALQQNMMIIYVPGAAGVDAAVIGPDAAAGEAGRTNHATDIFYCLQRIFTPCLIFSLLQKTAEDLVLTGSGSWLTEMRVEKTILL